MSSVPTVSELLAAISDGEAGPVSCVDAAGRPCSPKIFAALAGVPAFADLTYDSRAVVPGALFVCKGAAFKPAYLADAVGKGAVAYLAARPFEEAGVPGVVCADLRRAMACAACAFFGNPSHATRVVGITGTKGKTTTAFYLNALLGGRKAAPTGLFTGLVLDDGLSRCVSHNTTPEAVELQRHLARAVEAGCDTVVMEASSQGFKYHRTLGTRFAVGLFTNIGEDHVSPIEHPTFEDYFASKLMIFDQADCAVVNLGCDHVEEVLEAARRSPRLLTYAADPALGADVSLAGLTHEGEGSWLLDVAVPGGRVAVGLDALGRFNVENALAALAAAVALGTSHDVLARGLRGIAVPGRMERYDAPDGSLVGIVDYAHNGMSMEALLRCVREEFPDRELSVVFGATGEKGVQRRGGLGHAAGRWADRIVLTEDDPGRVPVAQICAELAAAVEEGGGAGRYTVVENRVEAVRAAVAGARRPGVVVLAGKGAEGSMLRAAGPEPCPTDAELICAELGRLGR